MELYLDHMLVFYIEEYDSDAGADGKTFFEIAKVFFHQGFRTFISSYNYICWLLKVYGGG